MIANLKSWWDLSLVAGCGLAVGLALFYRSSGKHSPVFPNEKKGPSAKHIQDRGKAALLGGVALAFVVSWLVASKLSRENAAMHLIGDDVLSPGLLAQIEALRSDWQIPGVSIAVVKMDEQDHWHKQTVGLGRRNGKGGRVTDETLFSIASNSKLFTSISVGIALSRANLPWTTPVRSVLPAFRLMDPKADQETTVIESLSHLTGVPGHDLSYSTNATVEQIIGSLAHLKPSAPYRTRWQYNNVAYMSASYIPWQLFGERFEDFVVDNIWTPLGMTRSYYDLPMARATNQLVSGFGRHVLPGRSRVQDVEACWTDLGEHHGRLSDECRGDEQDLGWYAMHWQGIVGAGGVISCAKDMAIWLQTLLLDGRHPETDQSIIASSIIQDVREAMVADTFIATEPETSASYYGMAQRTYTYRDHEVVEHGGQAIGQKSQIIRVLNEMVGVAVMVNDEQLGDTCVEVIKWMILDELLGLDPIDWRTRKLTKFLDASKPKEPVQRPIRPMAPSGGYDSIVGTYFDKAYGDLVIEPVNTVFDHQGTAGNPGNLMFRAAIDKVWMNELLFTHFDGNAFNVTGKLVLPETAAVLWDVIAGIQARFGEGGVGFQGIWRGGTGVENGDMDKFGIRNGAEVFFERKG